MKACMCLLCSNNGALVCLMRRASSRGIGYWTSLAARAFWPEKQPFALDLRGVSLESTLDEACWPWQAS